MIHGQVASSGTSGGADAKGDVSFRRSRSNLLALPPAARWPAEPTRDNAPRRPDRRFSVVQETASRIGAWMM